MQIESIRNDFPILQRKVHGRPLIYFDNGATYQKPVQVIEKLVDYYSNFNANIHRGVHSLSQEATDLFEEAREKVSHFFRRLRIKAAASKTTTTTSSSSNAGTADTQEPASTKRKPQ